MHNRFPGYQQKLLSKKRFRLNFYSDFSFALMVLATFGEFVPHSLQHDRFVNLHRSLHKNFKVQKFRRTSSESERIGERGQINLISFDCLPDFRDYSSLICSLSTDCKNTYHKNNFFVKIKVVLQRLIKRGLFDRAAIQ